MSEGSSQQQQQQSRYKTITSENDTRNPTTNKKHYISPTQFQRSNHLHPSQSLTHHHNPPRNQTYSLRESLTRMKYQKIKEIEAKRYSKAEALDSKIKRTQSLLEKSRIFELKKQQIAEKRLIREAYHEQIIHFQRAWNNYFEQIRQKEIQVLKIFKQQQRQEIQIIKANLRKKYSSLRHTSRNIVDLQKKENYYIKKGNSRELSLIQKQKRRAQQNSVSQRESMIKNWTEVQQTKLSKNQYIKYSSLIAKLQQNRTEQQKFYKDQRARLKQKYKNVLSQLKHEQRMTSLLTINWKCTK